MCNWFQNKSPTHTFAVDWDTRHGNWAAPCYFNGASPTGSARWGYCLQRHLACEGLYGVSNHQPHNCLHNGLFRPRSKKTSKPRVTGLCEGNSPMTGEFPAQRASNAENVFIWWRHHEHHQLTSMLHVVKTHRDRNKMTSISMTFSNAFCWMKTFEFRLILLSEVCS